MPDRVQCPHLPSLGAVYEVQIAAIGTPSRATHESWSARLCARCAEQMRAVVQRDLAQPTVAELAAPIDAAFAPRSRAGHWYLTRHAVECLMRLRRLPDADEGFARAEHELARLAGLAGYKQTDASGRELWRTSKGQGDIRLVVSYERRPEGPLPQVVWVGQGRPPERHWAGTT